jgi:RecG-like helicase
MDVIFGSGNQDDEEDDDLERHRRLRTETVERVLAEQDEEFRNERRQKQWGRFANATSREEIEEIEVQERLAIARGMNIMYCLCGWRMTSEGIFLHTSHLIFHRSRHYFQSENEIKKNLAKSAGVVLDLLDPLEKSLFQDDNGNIQIQSMKGPRGWLTQVDKDLEKEWEALVGSTSGGSSNTQQMEESDAAADIDQDEEEDNNGTDLPPLDTISTAMTKTGEIISRDALQGVRVGSAGGWTLEVFPGDFVVHRKYGIGRFVRTCLRPKTKLTRAELEQRDARRAELLTQEIRNLQKESGVSAIALEDIQAIRAKFGTEEDVDPISNAQTTVLEISYADGIVHVPVDRAYRLSRYRAGDAIVTPSLSRVRGEAWRRAKSKVEENTLLLAQDVLALYATRESLTRKPFDPAKEELLRDFEETFPFTPTPDQLSCFEDVENDMVWRNRPMDRLVCGDVGFGKTEIALRAIFRCVVNGRQAALLAPTGVLAAQHYKNIMKRMGPDTKFGFNVTLLRGGMGRQTKQGKLTREQIENGEVNLIVGTHALLSNDLRFKDLGILVVDEEQRFGVKQKERLKLICSGVDVLTLSATPIPRTLQMSLSGIRDTSTIRSPPPMRKPTVTIVQEFAEDIVLEAISRELARGGQCYYVVPRISMLGEAEELINRLFPGVGVIKAHGRMQRGGAEDNVAAFAEGNYQVLLATTVIENGVDIPSVNTIIVQNSQNFGMSSLYQLRGRVGRSDLQ